MKKVGFGKLIARSMIFVGLTVLFVAAANGQSDSIGINGKIKTKRAVSSGVAKDFRRCVYPLCGGVVARGVNQRNAKRRKNSSPFDKGTLPPGIEKRGQAGILPHIEQTPLRRSNN